MLIPKLFSKLFEGKPTANEQTRNKLKPQIHRYIININQCCINIQQNQCWIFSCKLVPLYSCISSEYLRHLLNSTKHHRLTASIIYASNFLLSPRSFKFTTHRGTNLFIVPTSHQ